MSFYFTPNQISGFKANPSSITLNNPLGLIFTRVDSGQNSYEIFLSPAKDNGNNLNPNVFESRGADRNSIAQANFSLDNWLETENQSISTSQIATNGTVNSIFNPGDYTLKIRKEGTSEIIEAKTYESSANTLLATFENGVEIQLSSLNTVIQLSSDALSKSWASDLKYSNANYLTAINTLSSNDPSGYPQIELSQPIKDTKGRIKVAYQFNQYDPLFGIGGINPIIETDEKGRVIPKASDEILKSAIIPSYDEVFKKDSTKADSFPWYAAVINDPTSAAENQQSASYFYLNGSLRKGLVDQSDQYDLNLVNGTNNNLDPYGRFPDTVGVAGAKFDDFQFAVTLWVPESSVFRPKGGGFDPNNPSYTDFQKPSNTQSGALEGFAKQKDGKYTFTIPEGKDIEFYNPEIGEGLLKTVYPDAKGQSTLSFSDWYKNWWENNTLLNQFPWTGNGYTYDWYYPTDKDWFADTQLGPGVGELVQSWRPEKPQDINDWVYEVVDVQTIPEAMGAESTAVGANWQLNIKKLGVLDATVHIYEADSITGMITDKEKNQFYPDQDIYLSKAIENAKHTFDSSELPAYRGEKTYALGELETNTNYGFVVEVNGNTFGTYGPTSSQFVGLSSLNSDSSLSIGFEDTVNGDNDLNDLIFIVSNLIA
ncbi:hypothetical protein H8F24_01630 [Synechococcus sp. CBW1002]|uniref:hypothetical protein n=1 Tax=Synechococcus sp. CBW1002 TaxID=1353134 RepID=UPI0018CD218E|nr:hypothetical protein [Synechococcus sp. CBW1002]QPN60226.1 hypothetical protein H8F24_01630 [Synechococcus sp. CBW1002]